MGGAEDPGAEFEGADGVVAVAAVALVVGATNESDGAVTEGFGRNIGVVDAGDSGRGRRFEDAMAGDTVGIVGASLGRFRSDLSIPVLPAFPISSLNPNFNSSGTFFPA